MNEAEYTYIINILENGGIGVVPTDTIYGIVGSALLPSTVERIFAVRARDKNKPLIILIASYSDIARFDIRLTGRERRILNDLWRPRQRRKTSVIMPCAHTTARKWYYLHRGANTLAFRLVRTKLLTALIRHVGPLVAPSANPQGAQPACTIRQARAYFGGSVDFYVSARRRVCALPSRIVRLIDGAVEIVRE